MTRHAGDEQMASLETRAMFAEQMTAGQIYRNELAHDLRELGYEIEFDPRRGLFQIRDVLTDFIYAMSSRAEQIHAKATEQGFQGPGERHFPFMTNRPPPPSTREEHRWEHREQ